MGNTRALGKDGFPSHFLSKTLEKNRRNVYDLVKNVFKGRSLEDINKTLIVLIPKKEKLEFIYQF